MIEVADKQVDAVILGMDGTLVASQNDVHPYPGIRDTLATAARHAKLAVLTGASRQAAESLLGVTQLREYFAVVVCGDDVARPQPEPDGVLEACARLGVEPARAAYVGKGPLELEAARRAGCVALAARWGQPFDAAQAAPVLARPTDLLATIEEPGIVTLDSRIAYENRWMRVREDRLRRPDGSEGIYGVVEKAPFSVIVAIDAGRVHLVQQFRYPVGARYWEFPQGTFEDAADTDPADVARGELAEETGLIAGKITHVGRRYNAYGFSSQAMHVFLAEQLVPGLLRREASEQDMRTDAFTIDDVDRMIGDGTIVDGCSVVAWHLVRRRL